MKNLCKIICLSVICCSYSDVFGVWDLDHGFNFFKQNARDGKSNNDDNQNVKTYSFSSSSSTNMASDGKHMRIKTLKQTDDNGAKEVVKNDKSYELKNGQWTEIEPTKLAQQNDDRIEQCHNEDCEQSNSRNVENFRNDLHNAFDDEIAREISSFDERFNRGFDKFPAALNIYRPRKRCQRSIPLNKCNQQSKEESPVGVMLEPDAKETAEQCQNCTENVSCVAYVDFLNMVLELIRTNDTPSWFDNTTNRRELMSFLRNPSEEAKKYLLLCGCFLKQVRVLAESAICQNEIFPPETSQQCADCIGMFFKDVEDIVHKMIFKLNPQLRPDRPLMKPDRNMPLMGPNFNRHINSRYHAKQFPKVIESFLNDLQLLMCFSAKKHNL